MRTYASPKLPAYAALAALGFLAALALSRPESAFLAGPFFLAVIIGLAFHRQPHLSVSFDLGQERVTEGEEVPAKITLNADDRVDRVDLQLMLPRGLGLAEGNRVEVLSLRPGQERVLPLRISCLRWGGYSVGEILLRVQDRLGFFVREARLDLRLPLRVYPRAEPIQSLPRPAETQVYAGNELSRQQGDGIEFADVRPFVQGDRIRHINWRLSSRHRELYVNEFHRERNADIVLLLDTFTELQAGELRSLDQLIRGARSVAERYLDKRNQVGVIGFGGTLRWLKPGMGELQRYLITEALIDTDITLSYAWKGVDLIPRSTLPPKAFVIAFSPLLDERTITALFDLHARRFDLAIVEISPDPYVSAGPSEQDRIAFRLWKMERESLRYRFQQLGISVTSWRLGEPLARNLEEVQSFRRFAHHVRA